MECHCFDRSPFLRDEAAFLNFIAGFENGSLPKARWTHEAHVAACAWYSLQHESPLMLLDWMRKAISSYNVSVGGQNTESSGYHETLTRLWCELVFALTHGHPWPSALHAARTAVMVYGHDRGIAKRFYSFDVVNDRAARREWREPDLATLATLR